MAKLIKLDKCCNVGVSNKVYDVVSYTNYSKDKIVLAVYNNANTLVRRILKLNNRIIDFEYYTKRFDNSLFSFINSVNSSQINIGGLIIPKNGAKLLLLSTSEETLNDNDNLRSYCKVQVKLEIADEKPVLHTVVPVEDVFFVHPVTKRRTRIQFSSDPDFYLKDTDAYPNAIHVANGLGFYSESRPDLNIVEPVPLNKITGNISADGVVFYEEIVDAFEKSWNAFEFPKKGLL